MWWKKRYLDLRTFLLSQKLLRIKSNTCQNAAIEIGIERADLHDTNILSSELILVSQIFSNGAEF